MISGLGFEMRINNLDKFLEKVRGGELALGAVTTFADPAVTELTARAELSMPRSGEGAHLIRGGAVARSVNH